MFRVGWLWWFLLGVVFLGFGVRWTAVRWAVSEAQAAADRAKPTGLLVAEVADETKENAVELERRKIALRKFEESRELVGRQQEEAESRLSSRRHDLQQLYSSLQSPGQQVVHAGLPIKRQDLLRSAGRLLAECEELSAEIARLRAVGGELAAAENKIGPALEAAKEQQIKDEARGAGLAVRAAANDLHDRFEPAPISIGASRSIDRKLDEVEARTSGSCGGSAVSASDDETLLKVAEFLRSDS